MREYVTPNMPETKQSKKGHFHKFCGFCVTLIVLTGLSVLLVAIYVKPPSFIKNMAGGESGENGISGAGGGWTSGSAALSEEGERPDVSGLDRRDNFFTMVVAGLDIDKTRTDTILLVSMNTDTKELSVMHIPRDTRSYKANGAVHKINAAYGSGIDRMKKELKNTVGFEPDRYVVIDYQAFQDLVDAIGGVEIDVPMDMKYDDPDQDLHINLKAGVQTLDGEDALKYMRFRSGYPDADLGRIKAQQVLIRAVAEKLMKPSSLLLVPKLIGILNQNVVTDLSTGEMIWLSTAALSMDYDNLRVDTLPGGAKGADFAADEQETLDLVNTYYNPYIDPIEKLNIP